MSEAQVPISEISSSASFCAWAFNGNGQLGDGTARRRWTWLGSQVSKTRWLVGNGSRPRPRQTTNFCVHSLLRPSAVFTTNTQGVTNVAILFLNNSTNRLASGPYLPFARRYSMLAKLLARLQPVFHGKFNPPRLHHKHESNE